MEVLSANSSPGKVGGGTGRKSSSSTSSSPEFEFWMVRNPSFPQTHLPSADELFGDGVILPLPLPLHLHLLPNPSSPSSSEPEPESHSATAATSSSKRWTDIFKAVSEKKAGERRKERRMNSAGGTAELNINLWPFSRSSSAGSGSRNKLKGAAAGSVSGRKVSSEPCSRSNSQGETSKSPGAKKWTGSPGRLGLGSGGGGVHVGRAGLAWRKGGKKWTEPKEGGGDRKEGLTGGDRSQGRAATGALRHFNLRTLFSKKVY